MPDELGAPDRQRRLHRRTLAAEVADSLRSMILTGQLGAGEQRTQDALAEMLGVSTMPVREAVLRLAAEGFLEVGRNKTSRVVPITGEDIRDIYWVQATLAGQLAHRACSLADDELATRLQALDAECREAIRSGDTDRMQATNWNFHRAINHAAHAPKLLLILRTALRFIPEGFYARVPGWAATSERGHAAIVAAFVAKDPDAAAEASAAHVREAGELLAASFTSSGAWSEPAP